MLDSYIIDRIRRKEEENRREGGFIPLHIEAPRPAVPLHPIIPRDEHSEERGSTVVDFRL